MKRIILSILCLSVLTSIAFAQNPRCRPRAEMIEWLGGTKYAESIFATGNVTKDVVLEFFVNAETGTFTVIATTISRKGKSGRIAGESCVIAGGQNFQFQEYAPKPKPTKHTMLRFWQLQ